MSVPKSWRTLEIEQKCSYGWTLDNIKLFLDNWSVVKDYAFICHDKDEKENGTLKDAHCHCMIRFNTAVPTSAIIARGVSVFHNDTTVIIECLERCKKWTSAVAYLTHENVQGKHIYSRSEVISNYDFESDIDSALTDKIRREKLITDIANGTIKLYDVPNHCTVVEFDRWKKSIDNAFTYRQRILLQNGDRNMKCVYIQGDSGVGKSSYAKELCDSKEYSYFVSSGSNDVLDGYAGQDAIILDDLRPSALRLADLLKMLDNNTASSVPSRYSNKVLECRLIVITTVLPLDSFFAQVFSEQPETAKQLRRRCETYIKMSTSTLKCGIYNPKFDNYIFLPEVPNPIAIKYGLNEEQSLEIMGNSIRDMLKGTMPDNILDDAVQKLIKKTDFEHVEGQMSIDDIPFNK